MAKEDDNIVLSPTVLKVIKQFAADMRADAEIEDDAIDRLESILLQGNVPKPDSINEALFNPPQDGDE